MKKILVSVLILMMCFVATASQSEVWVGVQGGPVFNGNTVNVTSPLGSTSFKGRSGTTAGLIVGYNFVNYGTCAYNWPDWAKYLGVQMDLSFSQYNLTNNFTNINSDTVGVNLLLTAKLPLMVDKEYQSGRLQPYVGIGSGVAINNFYNKFGSVPKNTTNVALLAETGVRYMVTPAFSANLAYRFAHQFTGDYAQNNLRVNTNSNNHMVMCGIAYHF
jgi:opacity protein-like surface antigen